MGTSSEWVVAAAAFGGAVVGGGVTLIGQHFEGRRRLKADRLVALSSSLTDLAEGAAAVRIQPTAVNIHILRSALLRLVLNGPKPVAAVATQWLAALDRTLTLPTDDGPRKDYLLDAADFESRMIVEARRAGNSD